MTPANSYAYSGTSALDASARRHLRLVYDASRDRCQGKARPSRTSIAPKPVAVPPTLIAGTIMAIALIGVAYLFVSGVREQMVFDAIEGSGCQTVHVAPGDDLWSIATNHGVDGVGTYDVVRWIKERNGLSVSALTPGLELTVPGSI